ncbi:MAG: MalT-like region [Acidobacteriota bacterium]|jgi:tetratricopeptide (TPR) repeat protein|nr:MalT-like region [Acidobacteriota bacterium]
MIGSLHRLFFGKRAWMKDKDLPPEALALKYLREAAGVHRKDHSARLGHADDTLLGKYERGDKEMSRDLLVSMVEPVGQTPEAVDALIALHRLVKHVPLEEPSSPVSLDRRELEWLDRTCLAMARTLLEDVRDELIRWKKKRKARAARQEAERLWPGLQKASPRRRRELVKIYPRYRTWAMAERVCAASIRAAAHDAGDALELARFALFIAERVPEGFRSRIEGYCWGHVANAQRVGNDWDAADQSFVRTWQLWHADADTDLLPEWRLYSLEASLRREQHRFPEALAQLDLAWDRSMGNRWAAAHILLQKANVLEQMEDLEGALRVLDEAAPLVEGVEDPQLLFALRFNRADNLLRLEHFQEAVILVPEVRTMAVEQGDALSLTRVLWLEAKALSGQGRKSEGMDRLQQVWDDFSERSLPYDAALSALDLAVLKLEACLPVREMALGLAWVFHSKKIHREALVALRLFCQAAEQEAATVELTRRTIAEIERVRRTAPPLRD